MAKLNVLHRPDVDKVKENAQTTYGNAKDAALSTYSTVQDRFASTLSKVQALLAIGLSLLAGLRQYNKKKAQKSLKQAQKQTQKSLKQAQNSVQDTLTTGLAKTQDVLQTGMSAAQVALEKSAKNAQKNFKKAQKNLKGVQEAVGSSVGTGLDVLSKGSQMTGQGLSQAASSAKAMKESVQDQYAHYVRKRKRARTLFRFGLVIGVVLTLLYTPYPGSQVRHRLAEQWARVRAYIGL